VDQKKDDGAEHVFLREEFGTAIGVGLQTNQKQFQTKLGV